MDTPASAAIYCRISRDTEGSGLGVARQETLCRDLADRLGWTVAHVYVDNDISAYSGAPRPDYEQMCDDLKNGVRDGVLVVDQDRLTRHTYELETFIDLAEDAGVPIATVGGELDLTSSDGRFRARIMGAVARQESEKKSERLRRQRDQAAQRGVYAGGRRPYGYEQDGMTLRAGEAALVVEVARRILSGESLRQIALDLNARGITPVYSDEWSTQSLRSIVASPRAAGLRQHRGEIVGDAAWPPLLDRVTWERVRRVLGDPRRSTRGAYRPQLLSGLVVCGRCGATMHAGSSRDRRRYLCSSGPGKPGCGKMSIAASPLEEWITQAVLEVVEAGDLPDVDDVTIAGTLAALEEVEGRLTDLAELWADGALGMQEWAAARRKLEQRRDELQTQASRRHQIPADARRDVREWWKSAEVEQRRALVADLIDHVSVLPATNRRRGLQPERICVAWTT